MAGQKLLAYDMITSISLNGMIVLVRFAENNSILSRVLVYMSDTGYINTEMNKDVIMTCRHVYDENIFGIPDSVLKDAVRRTNNKDDPDSGNGLITKIWGPPSWQTFHAIQFGYPMNPTDEQKMEYRVFFMLMGKVLPCSFCKNSYQDFIAKDGEVSLTDTVMESRENLTKWGYDLHNRVNKKLGIDYGTTYEELCYKYESYRAKCTKTGKGCVMPLNLKSKSYQNADINRAPIIDASYSMKLKPHSKTLGLYNYSDMLDRTTDIERNSEAWMIRDIICTKIIKHMRRNGISSLDDTGLPSVYEMILISMLSTTLEKEKLDEIIDNLCDN
jgi:hypothetical protein